MNDWPITQPYPKITDRAALRVQLDEAQRVLDAVRQMVEGE